MRKPKDYDAELKLLNERAQQLKCRKVQQLGELVNATGADALPIEVLAGALLHAVTTSDAAAREGWRTQGAMFFQRASGARGRAGKAPISAAPNSNSSLPFAGGASAK